MLIPQSQRGSVIITINQTVDYMARGFMSFMRGIDITRAIGRVGLKVKPVLGPEIARATASAIWAQNRRDFQTNPSNGPSNVVMSWPRIKLIKPSAI